MSPQRSHLAHDAQTSSSSSRRSGATRARRGANGSACDQCRKRKIRCTGETPACARCTRLNKECRYADGSSSAIAQTASYLEELHNQVRDLEARRSALRSLSPMNTARETVLPSDGGHHIDDARVHQHDQTYNGNHYQHAMPMNISHVESQERHRPTIDMSNRSADLTQQMTTSSPTVSWDHHEPLRTQMHIPNLYSTTHSQNQHIDPTLNRGSQPISPPATTAQPATLDSDGPSPRYEAISTTYPKPHDRPLPSNDQVLLDLPTDLGVVSILEQSSSTQIPLSSRITSLVRINRDILPPAENVWFLIGHFEDFISAAFPIFHIPTLRVWVDNVCFKGEPVEAEIACSVLLVLAVSATSIARGSPCEYLKNRAASLWEYGQKFLPPVFLPPIDEQRGLLRVQVMLIRLQYVLYNPNAGNVWGLSGAAVRASVDLGLHHESSLRGNSRTAIETDIRRRVFWIAYSCDRDLGMALGRPPAIQDEWVTAQFPSDLDDSLITTDGLLPGPPSPPKQTAIHLFRIRKLQSSIIFRLYASGQTVRNPANEWLTDIQHLIEGWNDQKPRGRGFCSDEWLLLCYHQTTTLLHRPCPGNPTPSRDSLRKALQGSSATMRLYKEVYRNGRISFGWLSMYHLFISGVTYLNSLWQGYRNGWRLVPSYIDALLDMQVCTSVMEGLAALTPGTVSIRNTWEAVSERMIRQLSSHAPWDPLSRPPSPGGPNNHSSHIDSSVPSLGSNEAWQAAQGGRANSAMSMSNDSSGGSGTLGGGGNAMNGLMTMENPFDPFLLHPLGELSNDDWARAVASVFGPLDSSAELPFG
ncbi:hypothetical protein J008_00034 [Cryptococcus neoformans]|nr:hypothetical protein AYX14_00012 [Cryptococcus neoformans var. grubii]OWZ81061.1 hypothetical protein C365_00028 [Cryptococcus neoformans var. grubii Bt85]OXG38245.1 hypothetical protein C367_00029 [Cryptococcus neoformans var. grubii Ze90-1]OXH42519.1 hypothetical protein J008_00034 [Cryptococcus neoformans var. grubii]OXM81920.1 hypothetical protein C364_00027 [Cryptococcus neoformans var. grubii Bt63]